VVSSITQLSEILKGVLEGIVLEIISREETYGYEIVKQLHDLGFEGVVEGTVYTILVRLEKNHAVDVVKRPSELGPPRKFYSLNKRGEKELKAFWEKWHFISERVESLQKDGSAS